MNQGRKQFAPETAIGTGAAEPVVDEVEMAKQVPSVDESTAGHGQNQPGNDGSHAEYSGESYREAMADAYTDEGGTDTEASTGEDLEVRRSKDEDKPGGDAVGDVVADSEVNSKAEDTRPEAPQKRQGRSKAAASS